VISSVGLEHYLDRVGVTGSNPVSPTMTKKIFLIPIVTLGIIFIILGFRWMLVDEPWMLDKVANEERLNMTFDQLFSEEINETLPGYLKQIYRFFGLWVSIIGLFIVSFAKTKFIESKAFAKNLLICIGIMVISTQAMAYFLIPSSPFIYLGWGSILLYLVSLWGFRKIS
jgi:hypothetical protein|tara:strand:- start:96 stop:605 length:510 start_codon:yes stop_codon:yes gene_type:complete